MQKTHTISSIYNYKIPKIHYNSDDDYRGCFQNVFFSGIHDNNSNDDNDDNDDETKQNDGYEKDKVDYAMEYLFNLTKDDPLFCNLYELAAAQMISTEKEIGQCILFSYHYFHLFHSCLCCFIQEKELTKNRLNGDVQTIESEQTDKWNSENPAYKTLLEKLVR